MTSEDNANARPWWRWVAAFPLVIGCLLVGNLAGYVFTSVADFGGMDYQKPGGVVLAAVQSAFGCALSFWASFKVLGDESYANPCIVFLVVVSALLALLTVVGAFLFGEIEEYLTWDFASSVAGVAALEVTRRVVKNEVWT